MHACTTDLESDNNLNGILSASVVGELKFGLISSDATTAFFWLTYLVCRIEGEKSKCEPRNWTRTGFQCTFEARRVILHPRPDSEHQKKLEPIPVVLGPAKSKGIFFPRSVSSSSWTSRFSGKVERVRVTPEPL